jgi:hypothetical protein
MVIMRWNKPSATPKYNIIGLTKEERTVIQLEHRRECLHEGAANQPTRKPRESGHKLIVKLKSLDARKWSLYTDLSTQTPSTIRE